MSHRDELLSICRRLGHAQQSVDTMLAYDSTYDVENVKTDLLLAIARLENLARKDTK